MTPLKPQDDWCKAIQDEDFPALRALLAKYHPKGLPSDAAINRVPILTAAIEMSTERASHQKALALLGRAPAPPTHCHKLVSVLLRAGANPNDGGPDRHNLPLSVACLHGHESAVRQLLAFGADPQGMPAPSTSPLHCAAAGRSPAVVRQLLAARADPNRINIEGRTPLHFAAREPRQAILREFYVAGADFGIRDSRHMTPLDVLAQHDPVLAEWWRRRPALDALRKSVHATTPEMQNRRPRL